MRVQCRQSTSGGVPSCLFWRQFALVLASAFFLVALGCSFAPLPEQSAKSIVVSTAFDDGLALAQEVMNQRGDDYVLVAARSSSYADATGESEWMYLYYSWTRARAYNVFIEGGEAVVADYANMALTQDDLTAAAGMNLEVGLSDAYQSAISALPDEGRIVTVRAYLLMQTNEPREVGVPSWTFSFNKDEDIAAWASDHSEEVDEGGLAPAVTVDVSAVTGDAVVVLDNREAS